MLTWAVDANNDIYLDDLGNIAMVSEIEALRQKLVQRLKLFLAEWFLDTTRGVPYFQNILGNVNQALATQIITNEILEQDEVTQVLNPQFTFDRATRAYSYTATVDSIYTTFKFEVNS